MNMNNRSAELLLLRFHASGITPSVEHLCFALCSSVSAVSKKKGGWDVLFIVCLHERKFLSCFLQFCFLPSAVWKLSSVLLSCCLGYSAPFILPFIKHDTAREKKKRYSGHMWYTQRTNPNNPNVSTFTCFHESEPRIIYGILISCLVTQRK